MCEQIHTHVVCTTHVGCTSHVLLPVAYTTSKVPITVLSGAGSSGEDLSELPVASLEKRQNTKVVTDDSSSLTLWREMAGPASSLVFFSFWFTCSAHLEF